MGTVGLGVANIQSQLTSNYLAGLNLTDSIGGLDSVINSPYSMSTGILGFSGAGYFGPGPEVKTMSDYLKWQEDTQGAQLDSQRRLNEKNRVSSLLASTSEDNVSRQIGILHDQIAGNEQDKVGISVANLKDSVRKEFEEAGYTNVSDEQIRTCAEKLYFEATGARLVDDIKGKGDSSFVHGLKQGAFGFGWLLENKKSAAENAAEITGEPVNTMDTFGLWAGRTVSAVATTAIALPLIPKICRGTGYGASKLWGSTKKSWINLFTKKAGTPNPAEAKEAGKIGEIIVDGIKTAAKVIK